MNTSTSEIGRDNERKAADYLKKHSYNIVELNYHCITGEIDIIARLSQTYVFCEVRSRRYADFGSAEDTIQLAKQRKIINTAMCYIKQHSLYDFDFRFDVIAINDNQIEHYENAFSVEHFSPI